MFESIHPRSRCFSHVSHPMDPFCQTSFHFDLGVCAWNMGIFIVLDGALVTLGSNPKNFFGRSIDVHRGTLFHRYHFFFVQRADGDVFGHSPLDSSRSRFASQPTPSTKTLSHSWGVGLDSRQFTCHRFVVLHHRTNQKKLACR